MNDYKLLKEKMDKFFNKVSAKDLVEMFEKLGYTFTDTIEALVKKYCEETNGYSTIHQMINNSPTYNTIISIGSQAITEILSELKKTKGGLNLIILLMGIVKAPYPYKPNEGSWDIKAAKEAWIEWGEQMLI